MPAPLFHFRQQLGLTQKVAAKFLRISPSLVAKSEAQNTDLKSTSEGGQNLHYALLLLYNLPEPPLETEPETDPDFITKQTHEIHQSLRLRNREHEKSVRAYKTARKKLAFVAAMRADAEFEKRKLEKILNLIEADAKLDLEKHSLAIQKKQSLLIRSLQQQLEFWENAANS